MKTISDINAIRDAKKHEIVLRGEPTPNDVRVTIGMGDAGLACGAQEVFCRLVDLVCEGAIEHVKVMREALDAGENAPVVVVACPGKDPVRYGKVDAVLIERILKEHIMGGNVLADHVID